MISLVQTESAAVLCNTFARAVAQLVKRWIPGGDSPGSRRSVARYDRDGPAGGSSRGQLKSVECDGPWLTDGHGKLSIPSSPNNQELPDQTVGARACTTNTA